LNAIRPAALVSVIPDFRSGLQRSNEPRVGVQTQRESTAPNLRRITRTGHRACGAWGIGSKRVATEALGRVFEGSEGVVRGEAEGLAGGDGHVGEVMEGPVSGAVGDAAYVGLCWCWAGGKMMLRRWYWRRKRWQHNSHSTEDQS
jgi:hypothetical protein